jgi:hypothetical protein
MFNPHFHTLALAGVFTQASTSVLEFHPAPAPSDDDVAEVLATIRHWIRRLLVRRGSCLSHVPGRVIVAPRSG